MTKKHDPDLLTDLAPMEDERAKLEKEISDLKGTIKDLKEQLKDVTHRIFTRIRESTEDSLFNREES